MERWEAIEDAYHIARDLGAEDRSRFLDERCGFDVAMRRQIEVLVAQDRNLSNFLNPPAVDLAFDARATTLSRGRFSINGLLGQGGMGTVYEAFDLQRNCTVALKTLTRLDAGAVYRLKNEFRALADVTHVNVVKLYELFSEHGQWFFTMELVAGEPFTRWVRPGGILNEPRLRGGLRQLVEAVTAIHAANKLHRDLKPNNVLVTPEGRVVVLDFGLAVDPQLGEIGQTITDDRVLGTPAYMPPEQTAGGPATAAGDVYEIGVMLFEALTGTLPFRGQVWDVVIAKQRETAPLASTMGVGVPSDLDALCARLLARAPEARPEMPVLRAQLALPPANDDLPAQAPPELVGRATELAILREAFDASCTSVKPVVVLLSGESGIGKSALCEAFSRELRLQQHAVVFSGRCFERESVPFKAFDVLVDEISRYFRKLPERELLRMLPRATYALRCLFPVLGRIDAIAEAPSRDVADPHELRRRAFLAFGELLGRIRDRAPLVLHIDDLQWADGDSMLLLMHLLRQAEAPPLLLVVSHRSEHMHRHPQLAPLYEVLPSDIRLDVRQLRLGPLRPDAANALLRKQVGWLPEALARGAVGNPFLLRELGRYVLAYAHEPPLDISFDDVVVTRAASLPQSERKLLQVVAVAGGPIDLRVAVEAAQLTAGPRMLFDTLSDAHLVRATGDGTLVECYHDKVRDALVASLTAEALRAHHAALASALAGQARADPEQLAYHLSNAGDHELAARHLVRAAELAYAEFAFEGAARLFARALECGRFDPSELQRLRIARADALAEAGRGPDSAEAYLAAVEHASGEAKDALEYRAGHQYLYSGRLEQGRLLLVRSLARRGVRLPPSDVAAQASLAFQRARLRWRGFEFRERQPDPVLSEQLAWLQTSARALGRLDFVRGADLSARYLKFALDAGDAAHVAIGLSMEIWHRTLGIGNAAEVPSIAERAELVLSRTNSLKARCWFHFCRGFYRYYGPEPELLAAIQDFERFLALTRDGHYPNVSYDRSVAEHNRVNARVRLGRVSEAARELPALLDHAYERGDFVVLPLLAGEHGTLAFIAVGALDDAQRELERAARAWSSCGNAYTFQDYFLLAGATYLALARGQVQSAWDRAQEDLTRFWHSALRPSRPMGARVKMSAATAALALAAQSPANERAALVRAARQLTKGISLNIMSGPLWASVAWLNGARDAAVTILRETLSTPESLRFPLQSHMIRRRLGELIRGEEGKALMDEADGFLREGGTVDPARLAATCTMAGIEVR